MANKTLAHALTVAPLVIGLAHQAAVKPAAKTPVVETESAGAACALDLGSCPVSGCADPTSDPAHALVNQMKRRMPSGAVKDVVFDDFRALQEQADTLVGQHKELEKEDRDKLKNLKVSSGLVSEGDLVRLKAFLIGSPHANAGESVNCGLKGADNNDFHIPVGAEAGVSEFEGIVTEMIPQARPAQWTLAKLRKVVAGGQEVLITGQLLYDNMHLVNDDPEHDVNGQPKRVSLWEIHRVTAMAVCTVESCDAAKPEGWVALEDWTPPATHVTTP